MYRFLATIIILLVANNAFAKEYDIDLQPSTKHLYFTDLEIMDRFETVTVFISSGKVDNRIADTFYVFAELIGQDNGATKVDMHDYRKYTEVLARLNCRPLRSEDIPAVVFTAKSFDYCQVFPLTNPVELTEILYTIQRNLSCPSDLAVDRTAHEARKAVNELVKSVSQLTALKRSAYGLIDFLAERMRITCKKEVNKPDKL